MASAPQPGPQRFPATDGRLLGGALALPRGGTRAAILITSAMGVRHRLYAGFADFLAAGGFAVLRFDHRGIGESVEAPVRRERARLHQWGELDIAGAIDWLGEHFPGLPLGLVGHSGGGWLPGLAGNCGSVRAMLTVASQNGFSGHWPWPARVRLFVFWRLLLPLAVAAWGYLPRWLLGSEPLPAGVAREWAAWARRRDFIRQRARATGNSGYADFHGPLRAYAIAGDFYAPEGAVRHFPELYPNARAEVLRFAERGSSGEIPGHFNVFRESFRDALWAPARGWLAAALGAPRA